MQTKKNKFYIMFFIFCALAGCTLWKISRTVEIIDVHHDDNHGYVLVKNFPFTDKSKIEWWLKNKKSLSGKYKIPSPNSDGSFVVVFWNFGEGYKETDGYDRLCFNDMKPPINCIDKNSLLMVRNSKNTGLYFVVDSTDYYISNKGEIVEIVKKQVRLK